jgi:hypothetical protein
MAHWYEYTCEMCARSLVTEDAELYGRRIICNECSAWRSYWDNLTDAERETELQAMNDYASESDC